MPDTLLIAPAGHGVIIGCGRRDDCVEIKRRLGGDLVSGPVLGDSLVVG